MFEFFQQVSDFISTGIYEFFVNLFSWGIIKLTTASIEMKMWAAQFAWDIGKDVLKTFDLSGKITAAINGQPSEIQNLLYFFRIPEVLTNLLAGLAGRWALRFIPFA